MMSIRRSFRRTMLACYGGYVGGAVINNFAPLLFLTFQSAYGISLNRITVLASVNFAIQLLVDLLSTKIVDRVGYRVCIVTAQFLSALGLIGLAVLPDLLPNAYIGLLLAVFLYAVGSGLDEVLISPIIEACPTDDKSASMSLLHSFYCWGYVFTVTVSTAFFVLFGIENWRILSVCWALIPLADGVFFMTVPIASLNGGKPAEPVRKLFSMRLFWVFAMLMVCSGAAEQAVSQWASAFAESALGVSKTLGDLTGPCLFAVAMGAARTFYARSGGRVNLTSFMIGSGCLSVVGYLMVSLSPWPAVGLVGCTVCGLAAGIMWPGTLSLASAACPAGGTALFALLALAGDLGCASGPAVTGFVSDLAGGRLKVGLAAAIVFPVLLVVGLFLSRKWNPSRKK